MFSYFTKIKQAITFMSDIKRKSKMTRIPAKRSTALSSNSKNDFMSDSFFRCFLDIVLVILLRCHTHLSKHKRISPKGPVASLKVFWCFFMNFYSGLPEPKR